MVPVRRILVPVDFSPASRAALDEAIALAGELDGSIEVLHVAWNPPPYVGFEALSATLPYGADENLAVWVQNTSKKHLEEFLADVEEPWRSRVKRRFAEGDAAEKIIELASHETIDLIVMGTHGRRGLAHLILGSVAEKVVQRAPCPVMTVRHPESREERPWTP